ncbi:hypothetical protein Cri9333_4998 (plasmid) [Crinalium epipsammum PCC 9333]|uniref:Uncharacterized protein n=1 Tax=Crinalium epipsammum PCC 9333 TaxID=1173022 RepID=K9W5Y2_9CYAN|nr:hypothetical protein [Crinalium epipsammum]AFZ15753.1 hypothetical protein Cri9333_4998 [Crinalium epipsammum PCC 9333]
MEFQFMEPRIEGYPVDWCCEINWAGWCSDQAHQLAADKYCQCMGFDRSIGWSHTEHDKNPEKRPKITVAYTELMNHKFVVKTNKGNSMPWKFVHNPGGAFAWITCIRD